MKRRLWLGLPTLALAVLAFGCNREQAGTPALAPADAAASAAADAPGVTAPPGGGGGGSNADKGLGKRGAGKTRASEAARSTVD